MPILTGQIKQVSLHSSHVTFIIIIWGHQISWEVSHSVGDAVQGVLCYTDTATVSLALSKYCWWNSHRRLLITPSLEITSKLFPTSSHFSEQNTAISHVSRDNWRHTLHSLSLICLQARTSQHKTLSKPSKLPFLEGRDNRLESKYHNNTQLFAETENYRLNYFD